MKFIKKICRYIRNKYYGLVFSFDIKRKIKERVINSKEFLEGLERQDKSKRYTIKLKNGYTIECSGEDLSALGETCVLEDYQKKLPLSIRGGTTVLDVGAHIGTFSIHSANKGAKVYAFEPHPESFEALKRNISINHLEEKVIPIPKGIWYKEDIMSFSISHTNSAGSSIYDIGKKGPEITLSTIPQIMKECAINHIDLLKIDIEGSEYEIFQHLSSETFSKIDCIVGEYHILPNKPEWDYSFLKKILSKHYKKVERYDPYYFIAYEKLT